MRTAGMTVALAVCWLVGVVGAASLPPDDQYSPQQSPYRRDALRGPRGYPNWLEYHQAPSTGLQPPENKPDMTSVRLSDLSREMENPKDSMIRDLDFLSLAPGGWKEATARAMSNSTELRSDVNVREEDLEILPASREDPFDTDDTFQDQGPGSVEVYKLDLHRENSLLVPQAKRNQPPVTFRIKSKLPKKAKGDDILWKLKPIEPSKTVLPAIFREPPSIYRDETNPPELSRKIGEVRKGEVFTVGGVPELQVGCEGLEASDRKRRSSGPGEEDSDEEYKLKFKDPVYRESTEPILLRVTPIVLDFEDEPPSGQVYEELDELLKLKSSSTPEPTTKRTNRGDIDPALENYEHEDIPIDEMLPERGDLGSSSKDNARVQRSIRPEDFQGSKVEGVRFPREANGKESPVTTGVSGKGDDTLSPIIGSRSESLNHRGGRKLLWVQYPERHESQAKMRHHQGDDEDQDSDLWGFGEDDGEKLIEPEESDADNLRRVEEETRRREYERRRQEEMNRRRGERERHPHSEEHPPKAEKVRAEIERIRKEYERLEEKEQRERQRLEEERRRQGDRRQWEDEQRRVEEARRRQFEESQRRIEEEERRHRGPSHSRTREEEERRKDWIKRREEEERRIRLENDRNKQTPPAALTRPSPHNRPDNLTRHHQEEQGRETEERKLREYIERNRPINAKHDNDRRRPDDQARRRNEDEERRKHIEAQRRRLVDEQRRREQEEQERRRQMEEQQRRHQSPNGTEWMRQLEEQERRRQMEEQQRRHQSPNETEWRRQHEEQERRRQMEEQQRRHQSPNETEWRRQHEEQERRRQMEEQKRRQHSIDENERRRQMEEQRRRDQPDHDREREEERRRQLEEERKLQEYVRRNQPVNVPKRNSSQESDWQEQRRVLEEARQWEQHKTQKDGRSRGPSAPTNIGHRRSQDDPEELRRRQEAERLEDERRRFEEEGRKREEEYRRQESRRHEEERQRLVAQRRREEANRRRPNWQDSRRPANTTQRGDDRDPGELRRHETSQGISSNSRRNQDEWRRTQERERQRQQQHEERERLRMEQERNDRNNRRRRPQHENTRPSEQRQRGESARNQEETERRRREEARLNALPVSARIMIHTDQAASLSGRTLPTAPPVPPVISIGSRAGFGNEIDFPAISPNRPGLAAHRFPAPATQKPPTKSPSPCVWAIVNCCPANNRLTTCFESMGCPGVNWDPSPCRASIQSAARAQVLSFYDTAEDNYSRG